MNWRLFLQILQKTYTNQFTRLHKKGRIEKTTKLFNRSSMEPARKMQKFTPEECELVIDINTKGGCKFDIISKIESVCDDQTVNFSAVKDGESGEVLRSNGIEKAATDMINQSDDIKDLGDMMTGVPPTWQCVALDCEFVGVLADISALGRCSIVSYEGEVICDIYAQPVERITTYRTRWSGITKRHMNRAIPIESALSQIADIVQDKIVVGHGIHNDFRVLGFSHPEHLIRDTQRSKHLLEKMQQTFDAKQQVSLKRMAYQLLDKKIQTGAHCSVEDATVSMELYKLVREEWETSLQQNNREPNSGNDPDQSSSNTDETMDTKQENNKQEPSSYVDKILSFTRTVNGKITKKRKRKKKSNGLKAHFGQIIGGNKNLTDYFKEDATILKNGKYKLSNCLRNTFSADVKNGKCLEDNHSIPVSDKVTVPVSDINVDVTSPVSLRDSKTYPSEAASVHKNVTGQTSKEKLCLKNEYAQTIKHLLHDDFWQDCDVKTDT